MSILQTIANNPIMKNVLFGQLNKVFDEGNVEFMVVRRDEKKEIVVDLYENGEASIVKASILDQIPTIPATPIPSSTKSKSKRKR